MNYIFEIKNISKHFAGVKALDDVSFNVVKGSCHCLIGENGAGKSTLIKILTGAHPKTSGSIIYNGKEYSPSNTKDAMKAGIGCLFQELNVVEKLKVKENICLGLEKTKFGIIRKSSNEKVFDVLRKIDSSIEPNQYIEELSVAKRQVVEMAKALAMDSDIIIMDEPTAALTESEVKRLFEIIEDLKSQGITIIYISHRLEEIMELADYVTVLRDGKHIATKPRAEIENRQNLIHMMIGKIIAEDYVPNPYIDSKTSILKLQDVNNSKLRNISFDLYKGEILGFYGLIGAGKTEIARAIFGADAYAGEIRIEDKPIKMDSPGKAIKNGIALVPEERRTQGICTSLSIAVNTPMMNYDTVSSRGVVNAAKQKELAVKYIKAVGTACRNENQSVAYLSGGNQQKVVLSKCLNANPSILLLDEPTRGVDVGAKQEIYQIIRDLVKEGRSVIVFSSELPEILGLCDRIGLLYDGEIKGFVENNEVLESRHIMHVVTGGGE